MRRRIKRNLIISKIKKEPLSYNRKRYKKMSNAKIIMVTLHHLVHEIDQLQEPYRQRGDITEDITRELSDRISFEEE